MIKSVIVTSVFCLFSFVIDHGVSSTTFCNMGFLFQAGMNDSERDLTLVSRSLSNSIEQGITAK